MTKSERAIIKAEHEAEGAPESQTSARGCTCWAPETREATGRALWKCSDRTHGSYTHIMYTHPGACALKRIYTPGFMRGWIFIALGAPGVLTSNPPPRTSRKLPRSAEAGRVPDFWVCRPRVCPLRCSSYKYALPSFFYLILFSGNRQIPGLATGAVGHSLEDPKIDPNWGGRTQKRCIY